MNLAKITCEEGVLVLSGAIDHVSVIELIQPGLTAILQSEATCLRVDWGAVTFANSAALAMVLQWTRQAQAIGKTVRSLNVPDVLVSLARLSQLEFIFA